jgi:2-polyprenyl-6-methoxyphenol hydroxylase-like FAD-dependent oxidoreductase
MQTPILIVGAGPVGMTLALALARLGQPCMLVERNPTTTRHPKMDITNARSMEIFRALGVADALRAVAVPADHPFDVAWVTTLAGEELHRFRYPSVTEWRQRIAAGDPALPGEAPMRVSQVEIEPVLQRHVLAHPLIEARWGVALEDATQDAEGVTATLRQADGTTETLRCGWLAGCDGGSSRVRATLGIALEGQAAVMRRFMTHFRSDARDMLQRFGIAWHVQSDKGTLIAQDDQAIWTLHTRWPDDQPPDQVDPRALLRDFIGAEIKAEILVANAWTPHLLVAEHYGQGRIWLAGDAAHQYIPTGGYGMNTGIADAWALAWVMAAQAQGHAGPALLPSYEAERLPIGRANREASGRHAGVRREVSMLYAAGLPPGELGARIAALGNAENESWGVEWGYRYRSSPILPICPDEVAENPLHAPPVTTPGARLPCLVPGLHDRLGPWFTLLHDGAPDAAWQPGPMLTLLQLPAGTLSGQSLLVRPDHHIAWRGTAAPDAPRILARSLGFGA